MARANTASLDTNFNVDPYYDDFDESKNFHRVLFRPGYAVQARELTQMQTIMQNQVDRFGEHIFKEGSVVTGLGVNYDDDYKFVKVRDADFSGSAITANAFIGATLRGDTSNVNAIVIGSADGSEINAPDYNTLYVKYIDSGTQGTAGNTYFTVSEKLVANNAGLTANVITGAASTGSGSLITFEEGIIFAKDHFIRVPQQSLVVGKYSANVSYKIGFNISEEIVTSDDDTSLLDPSQGSFNYTAPGATRLKLSATLAKYEMTANTGDDFIELYRVKNRIPALNAEKPRYSDIRTYLAQRTNEINGDFVLNGLGVTLREHLNQANNQGVYSVSAGGDNDKLVIDVDPGKAYVNGFDIENIITAHVDTDKASTTEAIEAATISANYGNYLTVKEVAGAWRVNDHAQVSLYDQHVKAVSNNTFSLAATRGNNIGTARVRAIEYNSGTKGSPEAQYNLYLYDVNTTSNTLSQVKSISINNTSASQANAFADVVTSANGTAVFNEGAFNRSIFKLPINAVKTLRDTSSQIDTNFQFLKAFDGEELIGILYAMGLGVERDDRRAFEWYLRSAMKGHAGAQSGIGWYYEVGRGLPEIDLVRAYMWYTLSAIGGDPDALISQEEIVKKMDQQQIDDALELVDDYRSWMYPFR